MKFTPSPYSFLAIFIFGTLFMSCKDSKKESKNNPALSNQLNDSIYVWERSKLKYADKYHSYLIATSKDVTIQTVKELQYTYYPWKAELNKQQVDSFLVYLEKNLAIEKKVYKSAFGELPSIKTYYTETYKNEISANLLNCRLTHYNLTNSRGEKIEIEDDRVSINRNVGSISFGLAKWDLQGQKIHGEATLEITIPYNIYKVEVKPGDKSKTLAFGPTKIRVLEKENNVLHYAVEGDNDYSTDIVVDSCMATTHHLSFPEYFYQKLRMKPNLSYQQFVADSGYFEFGKKWKLDPKKVRVVYFESCDPGNIYIYGYRKTEVLKKSITIPIDAEIL